MNRVAPCILDPTMFVINTTPPLTSHTSLTEQRLDAHDNLSLQLPFSSQVVQLEELLAVRHSVFVVGGAGTGKSQVLRSLHRTYQVMKRRPVWTDLNPKAVTNDELFGIINPATREWKDGKNEVLQDKAFSIHRVPVRLKGQGVSCRGEDTELGSGHHKLKEH